MMHLDLQNYSLTSFEIYIILYWIFLYFMKCDNEYFYKYNTKYFYKSVLISRDIICNISNFMRGQYNLFI